MERLPGIYMYRRIVKAKLFIDSNYCTSINLTEISREAFFSKFHFIRLFKKSYGRTPHQYLIWLRIEKAKVLLQTDMPISEVCFSIGFESVGTFTALFKRFVKQTPALYQKTQAERKEQLKKEPLAFIPNCFAEKNGWVRK